MKPEEQAAILVIGVGNPYRGDDSVGLAVARKLRAQGPARAVIREENGEGASLIEAWRGAPAVIIVDAVQSGARPGTIHRLDAGRQRVPSRFFHYSTHAFSVAEAVELARTLNQLPPRLMIYGVEGKNFQAGEGLSPEVENAVPEVVSRVGRELDVIRRNAAPKQRAGGPSQGALDGAPSDRHGGKNREDGR
ncbi:MAG: hydrogenase maturation protease [Verrucomicrobiota bacterium]|nr:hydrogenase maturation protease [Verrucomicrobiota bacterium]